VLYSCFQGKGELLEQPEDFEDDHDNDNHSNYVKDVSAHAGNSHQIARAMTNIYLNYLPSIENSPNESTQFLLTKSRQRKSIR
jgi:hypothetical protein